MYFADDHLADPVKHIVISRIMTVPFIKVETYIFGDNTASQIRMSCDTSNNECQYLQN